MQYLAWLLKRFNGDLTLAAAGYNAGEGAVDKYRGVPPYSETQRYVERVARAGRPLPQRQGSTLSEAMTGAEWATPGVGLRHRPLRTHRGTADAARVTFRISQPDQALEAPGETGHTRGHEGGLTATGDCLFAGCGAVRGRCPVPLRPA